MNAKLRRHEARKQAAIQREADHKLTQKIGELLTGCSHKITKTLSLPSVRERKTVTCYVQKKEPKKTDPSKRITAHASERIVRGSKPLI